MINATVSHANTSFFKSNILDQIIFHRVRHFARYFLPCLPPFLFHIWWTLDHDKFSTVFNTIQYFIYLFFRPVCHFSFLPFSTLNVPTATSSPMCRLYLIVAIFAIIEWRFWFAQQKNLLLGTNSLVLSYTQIVVEVWRGLTELD